jgi:hypothetical protein
MASDARIEGTTARRPAPTGPQLEVSRVATLC